MQIWPGEISVWCANGLHAVIGEIKLGHELERGHVSQWILSWARIEAVMDMYFEELQAFMVRAVPPSPEERTRR